MDLSKDQQVLMLLIEVGWFRNDCNHECFLFAGSGKSETFKDLARALAVQFKVVNCSSELESKTMGHFLMGLASSGVW